MCRIRWKLRHCQILLLLLLVIDVVAANVSLPISVDLQGADWQHGSNRFVQSDGPPQRIFRNADRVVYPANWASTTSDRRMAECVEWDFRTVKIAIPLARKMGHAAGRVLHSVG
ncbi:MAG: hypothetical protein R3C28_06405 [Pirellulaceae bacterium]